MTALTLTDVRPWGGEPADVVIADGVIAEVVAAGTATARGDRVDGGGLLALPGFINAHAHVDKSWWGQPWVSAGGEGTTQGRIAHERAERDKHGIPSLDSTVAVLREFLRHGTTATRTHVDVDLGVGLRGIETVRAAAAALGGAIEVEIVAFPQDGVVRRPGVLDLLDRAAVAGATSVGGIDPASIDRDPVAQLDGLFAIAERRGVGLDIHLHDGGELGAFQCELIIDRTRRSGMHGMITISHGFAIGDLPPHRQAELLDHIGELGISWTTVAPVRHAPLPWRGMRERGIPIGLAPTASATCGRPSATATCFASPWASRDCTPCATTRTSPGPSSWRPPRPPGSRTAKRTASSRAPAPTSSCSTPRTPRTPWSGHRGGTLVLAGGREVVRDGELVGQAVPDKHRPR